MMKALGLALLGAALATAAAAQPASQLTRCDMYKAWGCNVSGCHDVTTKAWSFIDWSAKDYQVCDASGCTHHRFEDWPDGIYRSLGFVGSDLMVKLNLTDMSVVETGTALSFSVTSFGNCTEAKGKP